MEESFCKQQIGIDPEVLGYQVLVKGPILHDKTKGGIILTDSLIKEQQRRQNIGLILKIGPTAFKDRCADRKCEVGQWVAYSNFERSPEYINDFVLYYISDAHILARYSEEDVEKILERFK
jgi:co-chaperonin GroES (HSP10)